MLFWQPSMGSEAPRSSGGGGNCGKKGKKDLRGWTPVRYYIMYEARGYVGMGSWESVKKVEFLKNAVDEEKAKIESGKWLRRMKQKENHSFRLLSAKLVASTHKDILKLI